MINTNPEIETIIELLQEKDAELVTIGHGRNPVSTAAALAFRNAWEAAGGTISVLIDWPEEAASWLRQAQRLTSGAPDAWVVFDTPAGWVEMSRRLRQSTNWDPARTIGSSDLGTAEMIELLDNETLDGMRGATQDGRRWQIRSGHMVFYGERRWEERFEDVS